MAATAVAQEWDAQGNTIQAASAPALATAQPTEWDASGKPITATPVVDTRSLWQKAKDNFNANTQGAKPGDGAIKSAIENFGAGGGDQIRALGHPVQVLEGMGNAIIHPVDTVKALATSAVQNPARFLGSAGTGLLLGEGAGAAAEAASATAGATAGRIALLGKTPEEAYESALKSSTTLSQSERAAVVKTGLDNAIPVSKGGAEKVGSLIDKLNQNIKDTIASDPTRPVDPNAVATRADIAKAKFSKQVNAGGDLSAIDASKQQFLQEQGASTPAIGPQGPAPPMSAADAQEMKQGTYRVLQGKFGEQGSASVEAQKALARGLKEEIANQFPEIADLNANESRLLDLQPVLERAVNRISNHQLIGIGTPIASGAAKAVTGSATVGVVAGVLKTVLDNPYVKSRLAISLSKGANIPFAQAAARVGAYSAALGSASETPEN